MLTFTKGFYPWKPSEDATEYRQYHFYDMPLTGVICQDNNLYLYNCVTSPVYPTTAFVYVAIDGEMLHELQESESQDFVDLVDNIIQSTDTVQWAIDNEQNGIITFGTVKNKDTEALYKTLSAATIEWVESTRSLEDMIEHAMKSH